MSSQPKWYLGSWAYEWNANGSLKSVKKPSGQTISFEYDALGRRIAKRSGNKEILYIWSGNVLLHEVFKTNDNEQVITWVYEQGSFVPTAKLIDGESFSIVSDYIGRPVLAFDENDEKVWSAEYDIYGKLTNLQGDKAFIPFRQLGQYEDVETGLYYNRFRYYSPETGSYISQDPIGLFGNNPNIYAYVKDNNKFVDLLGLKGGYMSFIKEALHPDSIKPDNLGGYFEIQATGSYNGDRKALYEKSGIKDIWGTDYRAHHVSYDPETNKMIMQIVHNDYHKIDHIGGVKQFKENTGFKYDSSEAIAEAKQRNNIVNKNKHH